MGNSKRFKVVIPQSLKEDVLHFVHDGPTGNHMGSKRTYKRCRDSFWWRGMSKDVNEHVRKCEACGKNKHETHPNVAPLQLMDIPEAVFDKIQLDFAGPFPWSSAHEYRYALQIQDVLSRYLILVPTVTDDAKTAADTLFEDWVCKFGPPVIVQSDRGTHFAAKIFEALCTLAGMKHNMGAPGHAESQGQVERQNQLFMQVRCAAENNIDRWPGMLSKVAYTHNNSRNETTGLTPHQVVFATKPRNMERVLLNIDGKDDAVNNASSREYVERLKRSKEELQCEARATTVAAQKDRALESFRKGDPYKVGDRVRIQLSTAERGKLGGKKMAPLYSDVYRVKEVKSKWTYWVEPENGKLRGKIRHYNNLKLVERVNDGLPDEPTEESVVEITTSVEKREKPTEYQEKPNPVEVRRSGRARNPVQRLQMTLDAGGKRYIEEPVPLAEDGDAGGSGDEMR